MAAPSALPSFVSEPSSPNSVPTPTETPEAFGTTLVKAHALALSEWRKANNRAKCAPLGFASIGDAEAVPRRANFGGGWAVAFDQPARRSAFGLAGTGLLEEDEAGPEEQRDRLLRQWPYYRELPQLPRPAFAGYGIEGAEPYSDSLPDGLGQNSLAYVRIAGQTCTYNVWSRLGRRHLELLLDNLTVLEPDQGVRLRAQP